MRVVTVLRADRSLTVRPMVTTERPIGSRLRRVGEQAPHISLALAAARRVKGGETAGVVFVADDLGAWLVGLLADAGRKKLTTWVLGSDQERAVRQAATAA